MHVSKKFDVTDTVGNYLGTKQDRILTCPQHYTKSRPDNMSGPRRREMKRKKIRNSACSCRMLLLPLCCTAADQVFRQKPARSH